MRNLLLILLLANILYFIWGMFSGDDLPPGVEIVDEADLGPPLAAAEPPSGDDVASVGAVLAEVEGDSGSLPAVIGRSCVTVGPFRDSNDADSAQMEYAGEGMRTDVRSQRGEIFIGHSVQVPDIPSREEGRAMLRRLHDGGLSDAFVVGNEEDGWAISLGIFGNANNAEKVELQAKSVGFEVEIAPMARDGVVYFVDVGLPPGKGASAIVEKYGEDRVLMRDKATCPQKN